MTAVTYGLIAAWAIVVGYLLTLVNRERNLKREISNIKAMLESGQANTAVPPAQRD